MVQNPLQDEGSGSVARSRLDEIRQMQSRVSADEREANAGTSHQQEWGIELGSRGHSHASLGITEKEKDFMVHFFAEVDEVKSSINEIKASSNRIREITEERLVAVSTKQEEKLAAEIVDLVQTTNSGLKKTKQLLEKMSEETDKSKRNQGLKASELRIRDNLCMTLNHKFCDIARDYQKCQQDYKAEMTKSVKRQIEIVKGSDDISNEEVDAVIKHGQTSDVYRAAVVGNDSNLQSLYADVNDKYQDVIKLEQSVQELHQMFLDFALLTEQQGDLLDQIEFQVKAATEYIQDGNVNLEQALVYQKEIRKRWCCLIMICFIVLVVLLLISGVFNQGKGGIGGK